MSTNDFDYKRPSYSLYSGPSPVGYWVIGKSFRVSVAKAPSRWERFWTRRLLGWEWEKGK